MVEMFSVVWLIVNLRYISGGLMSLARLSAERPTPRSVKASPS